MGVRLAAALLLAIAVAPVAGAQQMCKVQGYGGYVEYPCGSGEGGPSEPSNEPWWASNAFQAVLAVVGLLGSAGAAGYTYYRVRRRRRTLTDYLGAIERTYAQAKQDPAAVATLAGLRADVRARHDSGDLDDGHFLELDKRVTSHLVKLRLLEIDRRFGVLSPLFLNELRRLVGDGQLTHAEADLVEVRAAQYRIPDAHRIALVETVRAWAQEDEPAAPMAVAPSQ